MLSVLSMFLLNKQREGMLKEFCCPHLTSNSNRPYNSSWISQLVLSGKLIILPNLIFQVLTASECEVKNCSSLL